jgi:hypothetical protein
MPPRPAPRKPLQKRIGKSTNKWGLTLSDECIILCDKCYRGRFGPNQDSWDAGFDMGEVDSPSHCYQCGVLLPNELTPDGVEYVKFILDSDRGNEKVRELWRKQFAHLL